MLGGLPVRTANAQSPEICAPVEQLDKYRYLRQLTLDLYGRIPTVEEYERLHSLDDVSDEMIDEMIGSPEDLDLHQRMAPAALRPVDGYLPLPTEPGLGVEPAAGCEDEFPYQAFEGWR